MGAWKPSPQHFDAMNVVGAKIVKRKMRTARVRRRPPLSRRRRRLTTELDTNAHLADSKRPVQSILPQQGPDAKA
jgi:hypothetical protein